jgi:hypothetical protein
MSIITTKRFNPTVIRFAQVERNKLGGKYVPLADENGNKKRVTLQTPTMHVPFGVSAYRERPDAEPSSYSIDISFRDYESNENILAFYNKMTELDNHLIESAHANSVEWFGKQKSRELLADTYRHLTKIDPSGRYAPIMKIKIPILDGGPNVRVFDVDKTPISIDAVQKGSTVKVICDMASVWFVGNTQWGVTFRAVQILVVTKPNRITDFAFENDDDEPVRTDGDIIQASDDDSVNGTDIVAEKFF